MWEGSHTDRLSGKSMFIDMHDIDTPDKSAFCFTVYTGINMHVVDDVARSNINYRRRSAHHEWSQERNY